MPFARCLAVLSVFAFCAINMNTRLIAASAVPHPSSLSVHGHISRGQTFERHIGAGLVVALEPSEWGWHVEVRPAGPRDVNRVGFASIATPPLHGPTPLDIEGWQFRNADNTATNDGSVNAPQMMRDFSFVVTDADANELAQEISAFQEGKSADLPMKVPMGHGRVTIRHLKLGNLVRGSRAWIESMDLTVSLRFP